MIKASRTVDIESLAAPVWEMVLDMIEQPLKYMPLAVAAEPVQGHPDALRSVIKIFGFTLHELVRVDEIQRVATWVLENNPDWAGYREIRVAAGPKQQRLATAALTLTFSWAPLSEKAAAVDPRGVEKLMEDAVKRWKAVAERDAAKPRR